jgi:hypothetical protein
MITMAKIMTEIVYIKIIRYVSHSILSVTYFQEEVSEFYAFIAHRNLAERARPF